MTNLSCAPDSELAAGAPCAVFAYEDAGLLGVKRLAPALRKKLLEDAQADGFKGKPGECVCVTLTEPSGARRYVVVGLGRRKKAGTETMRRAAAAAANFARSKWAKLAVFAEDLAAPAAEGLLLSSYRFQDYKKADEAKLTEALLVFGAPAQRKAAERAVERAKLAYEAVSFARDLVNRGPSDKSPQSLADLAKGLSGSGVTVKVLSRAQAQKLGMSAFLGVSRGSAIEPTFAHLIYKPKAGAKKKVGLVGKGITFDSGGLSLKPPQSMETMKMDMAGAASVLAVFKVLPRLAPKAEVHGFCAFTYNMPGPDAMKPGDVVKAMNGKTIEVLNTDAEGRLILADALAYAVKQELSAVIDLATLTGAVVIALGSKVAGAMANDKPLLRSVVAAAERADEPLCELPLHPDYKDNIKSSIADLQNIGKVRGEAGSIIGGLFLEEFVGETPWVHLDIAGTAWTDHASAYCPAGGTGSLVRTLLEYLAAL